MGSSVFICIRFKFNSFSSGSNPNQNIGRSSPPITGNMDLKRTTYEIIDSTLILFFVVAHKYVKVVADLRDTLASFSSASPDGCNHDRKTSVMDTIEAATSHSPSIVKDSSSIPSLLASVPKEQTNYVRTVLFYFQ